MSPQIPVKRDDVPHSVKVLYYLFFFVVFFFRFLCRGAHFHVFYSVLYPHRVYFFGLVFVLLHVSPFHVHNATGWIFKHGENGGGLPPCHGLCGQLCWEQGRLYSYCCTRFLPKNVSYHGHSRLSGVCRPWEMTCYLLQRDAFFWASLCVSFCFLSFDILYFASKMLSSLCSRSKGFWIPSTAVLW